MRILIVEDDSDTRTFVAQGLGQAGHGRQGVAGPG
jgi:two-component system OmpR family response regulator